MEKWIFLAIIAVCIYYFVTNNNGIEKFKPGNADEYKRMAIFYKILFEGASRKILKPPTKDTNDQLTKIMGITISRFGELQQEIDTRSPLNAKLTTLLLLPQ